MISFDVIIDKLKLFWQYPVITEKVVYDQQRRFDHRAYFAFPWATIIDKTQVTASERNINNFGMILKCLLEQDKEYQDINSNSNSKHTFITCCQHIYFKRLIPLFKQMNIHTVYSPHKVIGEDVVDGIRILSCPLYAVNIEDPQRNHVFQQINHPFNDCPRDILYSFKGGYKPMYLTDVRKKLFQMKHPDNALVEFTGDWHFQHDVYSANQNIKGNVAKNKERQQKTTSYNEVLLRSVFSLAPSGTGPNSIRFWESLACGSIPVLLADTLDLPPHPLWDKAIVRLPEHRIQDIPDMLSAFGDAQIQEMRRNCLLIYREFCDDFLRMDTKPVDVDVNANKVVIIHYCCGSYEIGDIGGVARYDYQIKLAFPERVFFRGSQQKHDMIRFLQTQTQRHKQVLVITDNHLACDIPNEYPCILVHHGSALTHAEREPTWGEPWKSLCCNGQQKMLQWRNPANTKIISISQFCYDEFYKYFGNLYTTFDIVHILHPSELDEPFYLKHFNNNPKILGNWKGPNKGSLVIPKLQKRLSSQFSFHTLKVHLNQFGGVVPSFNKAKQNIYLQHDIFLQLSMCEGNSYAALDALLCGLVVISTDVGLFYKDVPEDCFVKLNWTRINDFTYIQENLEYAWKHKERLSRNARKWYLENCRFSDWKQKMESLVTTINI